MLLLAFDTATPAVTVALHDGEQMLAERTSVDGRRHGELLAPAIADVLADAGRSASDLTGIAVGVGPGPFTGLRVGLMTARALADALGVEISGVCTLDARAPAQLGLTATADDAESLERLTHVIGSHLERFGVRDELAVSWTAAQNAA